MKWKQCTKCCPICELLILKIRHWYWSTMFSCSCSKHWKYLHAPFVGTNALVSGIPQYPSVDLDPKTPQGTKVFSYNLFLNISTGSPFLELDGNSTIMWYLFYDGTYHTGDFYDYYYQYYYYHYYQPQFGIKLPEMEVSGFINLTGPIEVAFPLSNTEIEQCSWGSSTFIKVPVEIYLESPYIYHLGTSVLQGYIHVEENTLSNYQSYYFGTSFIITTSAGRMLLD